MLRQETHTRFLTDLPTDKLKDFDLMVEQKTGKKKQRTKYIEKLLLTDLKKYKNDTKREAQKTRR